MTETTITVRGEYETHHPAERGTVSLTVGFEGPDRSAVLHATTELHGRVSDSVREIAEPQTGPVTWWSADHIRVWGERPWNQDGKRLPIAYHGTAEFSVKFSEFARLSAWIAEVALWDGVTVNGVGWALTEAKKQTLTQEARRRAVENAVAKATVYATSLGLSDVRPLAVSDPGMLGDSIQGPTNGSPVLAKMSVRGNASAETLDLKPEDITISAQVDARFAAS